jgi:hypothetical protein
VLTTAQLVQTPTYNFNKVSSIMYLDVGANWNVSDKTQLDTYNLKLNWQVAPSKMGGATAMVTTQDAACALAAAVAT